MQAGHPHKLCRTLCTGLLALGLSGCADTGYLLQSVNGHLRMMAAARPVAEVLQDDTTPPSLKARLELAQRIRRFAVSELALPDNASYTRYADLGRPAVVWNVVAAPALSLTLKTWCFPVAGCVGYRGYFDETQARAFADSLKSDGLEVSVYAVPAYSTLGWLNWAGGDPLLNTFINYPDGEVARLVFHELAHQVAYAKDDTAFNESFATAVERLGAARWLAQNATPAARDAYNEGRRRRAEFLQLTRTTRQDLERVYGAGTEEKQGIALVNHEKIDMKNIAMERFRNSYADLRAGWVKGSSLPPQVVARQIKGYDDWVANVNNASLGAQGAYDELVPAMEALYGEQVARPGQAWPLFYDAVKAMVPLPMQERRRLLAAALARQTPTATAP